ncbi:MAG: TrkH family potassium uptake protein [Lachnospiraceae bacterium]|nr:TrkH family potassium uptake protein [Lachnospiraceae bacterium]MBR4542014.1 TrkH family potassium uptake protein [Lachnospiraceae bacterium]
MNYGVVFYILGWILKSEAIFLMFPFVVGLIYGENQGFSFLITAGICLVCGVLLNLKKPKKGGLFLKEGYFVVALGWIIMSLFGALPFVMCGEIPRYIDAVFETASGFSTTGATILTNVEVVSHACLFWRSFTHLLGGMGVFVFLSALLPMLGGNTINLMKAESTGPSVDKLVPRIKDTVKILYSVYLAMGALECIILLICGLDLFESLCTTFGTIGTGGFGTRNDSIASMSPAIQWVVTIFMILSGVNYSMYFLILRKKFKQALSMEEIRLYFFVIVVAVVAISINISNMYPTMSETVRTASFQVGTLITSTGFATTDYDMWPEFSKTILILCMFMGACAGSTGGGIKMSRILILWKSFKNQIRNLIHPRSVTKVRMDGAVVDDGTVHTTLVYLAVFFIIFAASTLILSADGHDFTTNFTAVLATLNNMGPGMNKVGPTCNFAFFSDLSKLTLIFDMLAGRLELFPLILVITPTSWKKNL